MAEDDNRKVGYRNPPAASRFRKGQSGNPKGRPKGRLNFETVLQATVREKVVIKENGVRKTITKLEAALKQLVNKAASGDSRATAQMNGLLLQVEKKTSNAEPQKVDAAESDRRVMQGILKKLGNQMPDDEPTE
jgi:transcriptional regulator NrdR family protein